MAVAHRSARSCRRACIDRRYKIQKPRMERDKRENGEGGRREGRRPSEDTHSQPVILQYSEGEAVLVISFPSLPLPLPLPPLNRSIPAYAGMQPHTHTHTHSTLLQASLSPSKNHPSIHHQGCFQRSTYVYVRTMAWREKRKPCRQPDIHAQRFITRHIPLAGPTCVTLCLLETQYFDKKAACKLVY